MFCFISIIYLISMDGGGGTGWLVGWLVVQLSLYKKDSPLWMFNCGKVIFKRDVELRKKV